jgi:cytochrome c5
MDRIMKRLEIILKFLELEDPDGAIAQVLPLRQAAAGDSNLGIILSLIDQNALGDAAVALRAYVDAHQGLQRYEDPELAGLRAEAKVLERKLVETEEARAQMEKHLHAFHQRFQQELGPIIRETLRLRRDRLKTTATDSEKAAAQYAEAKQDYQRFEGDYAKAAKEAIAVLGVDDTAELKRLYRRACKLCHPDVVAEAFTVEASSLFGRLTEAYNANDLATVRHMLETMERRGPIERQSDKVAAIDQMRLLIAALRSRLSDLQTELDTLCNSEVGKLVAAGAAWDEYFQNMKARLLSELQAERQVSSNE